MLIHAAEKSAQQGKFDVFKAHYYGMLIKCADIEIWRMPVFKNKGLKRTETYEILLGINLTTLHLKTKQNKKTWSWILPPHFYFLSLLHLIFF